MSIGAIREEKDTFIFYVDAHWDLRSKPNSPADMAHVYPAYKVDGLKCVRIAGSREAKDFDSFIEGAVAYVTDALYVPPYRIDGLSSLIEEAKEYKVMQYHIDPDAFTHSNFIDIGRIYHIGSDIDAVANSYQNPELHFELIRKVRPNFVGIFEFPLSSPNRRLSESGLIEGIEELIEKTVPDAKNIILSHRILEIPSLYDAFKSSYNLYPYDDGNLRRSSEIQKLIREGRTFGIFDSHADALDTFRWR